MTTNPWTLPFEKLPASLPIFPLPNAVVMPNSELPLNIFEPRYLNMVLDAMSGERLIGMVQPDAAAAKGKKVPVYRTGTAGRITLFSEIDDGRLMIVLTGVCRFDIQEECPTVRGYRRIFADWSRFAGDYESDLRSDERREEFFKLLKSYVTAKNLDTDWETLRKMPTLPLLNRLIGALPFDAAERQFLIETVDAEERLGNLMTLLEYQSPEGATDSPKVH